MHNLAIHQGSILVLSDMVSLRHEVRDLQFTLPLLSSLPSHSQVSAEPRLAFKLDDATFVGTASSVPFDRQRSSEIKLVVPGLDFKPWLPYLPRELTVQPVQGVLEADLHLKFLLPEAGETDLSVAGQVSLGKVRMNQDSGQTAIAWDHLRVELTEVQPLVRQVGLGEIVLDGLRISGDRVVLKHVARQRSPAANPLDAAPVDASAGWRVQVRHLKIGGARADWRDDTVSPASRLALHQLDFQAEGLNWPAVQPARITLGAKIQHGAHALPAG